MSELSWKNYVDDNGDFELPAYLYKVLNSLMKTSLDLGTLLSDDRNKLRAYKEQTKSIFKKRWLDVAQALEFFDIIVPCGCGANEYCKECCGSRYRLNSSLNPDEMREIAFVYGVEDDAELAEKLRKGLMRALKEVEEYEELSSL